MNKEQLYTLGAAMLASTAMSGLAVRVATTQTVRPVDADEARAKAEAARKADEARERAAAASPLARGERMSVDQAMAATGTTSPSGALRKANKLNSRYGYIPHVGAKQRAKEARRQERAAAKAAAAR